MGDPPAIREGVAVAEAPATRSGQLRPHPRLLLSDEVLRRVKGKVGAGDAEGKRLMERADRMLRTPVAPYDRTATPPDRINYSYQGFGWLDAATTLGLAYQVTGKKEYAAKIGELLRAINATAASGGVDPLSTDQGFPSRSAALGVALAFDWAYPALSAADKAATVATLNQWFDWFAAKAYDRDGPAASNYFGGHLLGFGAAGYATAGDNDRAPQIIDEIRRRFDDVVVPAFANGALGGGYPSEGYVYGTNHYERLLQYTMIVGTATGSDMPLTTDAAARIARNLIHALKPNRWQVPDEADYPGETTGLLALGLPVLLGHVLGTRPFGAESRFLLQHAGTPPRGLTLDRNETNDLLFGDARAPATDYARSEPLWLHSAGDEHLFMRSSWSSDAVWASFSGGLVPATGHQARVAGHVAIQRGNDALLVYAGQWKGADGLAGQPQQFQGTSAYANTLFVDDGGEYLYSDERYRGGQGPFAEPRPLAAWQTDGLSFGRLDATAAYDHPGGNEGARSVRRFVRWFAYLRPDTFVILDRVKVAKPTYRKELRFHAGSRAAPAVSGSAATITVGGSALQVRVLSPRAPALKVDWQMAGGARLDPYLAVSDARPGTDLDALTVLTAADRSAPAREAALVTAEGGVMMGAELRASDKSAGAVAAIVMFAGDAGDVVPGTAAVRYRCTPGGTSRHYLFGLEPKRRYAVRATAAAGGRGAVDVALAPDAGAGAVTVNEAGAIVFDLSGTDVRPVAKP